MHVGRFGPGADDPRLLPLVWTLRDVVRGYADTGADASSSRPVIADKILIANAELRFPVAALFARRRVAGLLPFEGLVFGDAGRFWLPAVSMSHAATLRSAGAGLRVNAGGFIFEFDAVRPFDRSAGGWTFAVNFRPGF
jgi:hemolysin activation/secretion protein